MARGDNALFDAVDLPAALGLLTRLPVSVDSARAVERGAASAWAYPVAGFVIGIAMAAIAAVLLWLGIPAGIAAGLMLAISLVLTGAMHEDGLADTADGLWGGWDRARRLAIMKDSHIGVYGVCAIFFSLLLRWLALTAIISLGAYWIALIVIGTVSRAAMVTVMAAVPNARENGLSRTVGRPANQTTWVAIGFAAVVALFAGQLLLVIVAIALTLICVVVAKAKIGGQTGDILGAVQQITEIGMLITFVTGFS